ncbi:Superoxide dismutase [Taphrina deformans PYCC 5710]|uniref:Superoxide dismutase n=1 Tax=Taphrina deformans (strain PYCC 5710 / ATCC 11124 / CBS 356.35 / IMI 108563 / JCM 9778 / NBRC 8474) TaxID=1097556 RepID=R4X8X7_TAPDE|nr:Superoxide dismutase [Taphrina deformans PYCC 5710]|eukprot:CCG82114.1 Superoxide dismutase [Taphrina deformans PYCC 5710]
MHCTRQAIRKTTQLSRPRRCLHSVPTLQLSSPDKNGIAGFYSPEAYKVAWSDYQSHMIENLNRVSAETDYESLPLIKTITQTARKPDLARIYNFAAQAFSNHFFFDSLASAEHVPLSSSSPSLVRLTAELEASFKSIEAFEAHFSAVAESVLGSGWVWLVMDESHRLRILATYNAGTPFDFARLQHADPNTGLTPLSDAGRGNEHALYQSMGRSYALTPVACLSLWQHSFLPDYGVAGKAQYVRQWFRTVDWEKVQGRMDDAKRDDRVKSSRY